MFCLLEIKERSLNGKCHSGTQCSRFRAGAEIKSGWRLKSTLKSVLLRHFGGSDCAELVSVDTLQTLVTKFHLFYIVFLQSTY